MTFQKPEKKPDPQKTFKRRNDINDHLFGSSKLKNPKHFTISKTQLLAMQRQEEAKPKARVKPKRLADTEAPRAKDPSSWEPAGWKRYGCMFSFYFQY